MIDLKLTIDDKGLTFKIPENWGDITVDKFSRIHQIDEYSTSVEKTVHIINALTDIDKDYLYMMSSDQFTQISDCIGFLNNEVESSGVDSIELSGDTFYIKEDFDDLNVGEVASIEMLLAESNNNLLTKMPELLCIFLRKKKENGKLEPFKLSDMERVNMFRNVSIADINDLFVFFSNGEQKSTVIMKRSSVSPKKKKKGKTGSKN